MANELSPLQYFYRGDIERSNKGRYRWTTGWSGAGEQGEIEYPWMTRTEARTDAERRGRKAVFCRDVGH